MTFEQRKYSLQIQIERVLKTAKVGDTLSPAQLSSMVANEIIARTEGYLIDAYETGRLDERLYVDDTIRGKKPKVLNDAAQARVYVKDHGWSK